MGILLPRGGRGRKWTVESASVLEESMVRNAGVKGAAGLREGMAGGTIHQPREESARRVRSGKSVPPKAELSRKYMHRGEASLKGSPVGTHVNVNGSSKAIC